MEVTEEIKNDYKNDSVHKTLKIYFPSLDMSITNDKIWSESLLLKENLMQGDDFDFVGCIASQFSVTVNGISDNVKGEFIEVTMKTDDTEEIPLFHGYIDSVEKQTNRTFKKITAYDQLSRKGKRNIIDWYNGVQFPILLTTLRNNLFSYLEIEQEEAYLPNDMLLLSEKYIPTSLSALDLIKAICQINGVCGIINRNNKFEYRKIYSEPTTRNLLRAVSEPNQDESLGYYRKVDYQEYTVQPISKVTIRKSASENGVSYGEGENNYIIQANMLTNGIPNENLSTVAQNVLRNVKDISFIPFSSLNNGLPYMEVGKDAVIMNVLNDEGTEYEQKKFTIMKRELRGIQSLTDRFTADAEEVQKDFPTDSRTQIESVAQYTVANIGQSVEKEFGLMIQSVAQLPANPKPNVIYLIQGEVVVN